MASNGSEQKDIKPQNKVKMLPKEVNENKLGWNVAIKGFRIIKCEQKIHICNLLLIDLFKL